VLACDTLASRFYRCRGQVEPKQLPVFEAWKTDPTQDAGFIAPELKRDCGGCFVKKVDTPDLAAALDEKSPDAMPGQAMEIIVRAAQRNADQFDEPFRPARQMFSQTQEAYAVLAKAIQTHGNGAPVRPEGLVTFNPNGVVLPVATRIPAKKYG
jgi:hypothetical protein